MEEYMETDPSMQQANYGQAQNQAIAIEEQSKNIAKEQLDLYDLIDQIEKLLKGMVYKVDDNGLGKWVLGHEDLQILTDFGVQSIINTIHFYLNKNTLLSNYDEVTIYKKMEDFSVALADFIFMKYEKVFKYPKPNEIQDVLQDKVDRRIETARLNAELYGRGFTEEDIFKVKQAILKEMDLEKERDNIKALLMKDKLKHFEILLRQIQDAVHSTYLRALAGAERRTLRQHIHISEQSNPYQMSQTNQKGGSLWRRNY